MHARLETLPHEHGVRLGRALLSLEGLSVGDAFGERFFVSPTVVRGLIEERAVPCAPWRYTDDTEMALAIVEVLASVGAIAQDPLAQTFAKRYARNPDRGYGGGARQILHAICLGAPWREVASAAFDGAGSFGNGAAMRAGPIGAFFADDLDALVDQAKASAEVTHAHAEGQAGAVAVALAAAFAWRWRSCPETVAGSSLLSFVHDHVPRSDVRDRIARAQTLPDASIAEAARELGTGAEVSAADTVPFSLWCAARHLDDVSAALWTTVSGLGDRDTTCAIVGSIVVLSAGMDTIPNAWLAAREPLDFAAEP